MYYRLVFEYLGEETTFIPTNFYEKVNEDGRLDTFWLYDCLYYRKSQIPEVCFGNNIKGSLLSILQNLNEFKPPFVYIYCTESTPDVNLNHTDNYGDFQLAGEVRYRREVNGQFVGKIAITSVLLLYLNALGRIGVNKGWESDLIFNHFNRLKIPSII